jgi:hypothetical protein
VGDSIIFDIEKFRPRLLALSKDEIFNFLVSSDNLIIGIESSSVKGGAEVREANDAKLPLLPPALLLVSVRRVTSAEGRGLADGV